MTAISDVKTSYGLLKGKFLSYLLAIIGMLFVLFVLFALITLPIGLIYWAMGLGVPGAHFIDVWVNEILLFWTPYVSGGNIVVILTAIFLVALPIFALAEWVLGAVYGMSKDIVTTGESSAEGAFSWFRKKAGPFLATGVVVAIIVLGPIGIVAYLISWYYGFTVPYTLTWPSLISMILYIYLFLGILRMYIPAVVDDVGVIDGLKKSVSLVRSNFGRIFGPWTIYFILLFIWFLPIGIWGGLQGFPGPWPDTNSLVFWLSVALAGAGVFLDLLIIFPMMILGMTKIYHEIKGQ
ncbi:MAG: DUF7847 domain-containing protein [Candidatus Thorarchaeota archaeon]|jgi:hypothetical protein